MTYKERCKVYDLAIKNFGAERQTIKLLEEVSELQEALTSLF